MSFFKWLRQTWDKHGPARRIRIVEGDELPEKLPRRDLVLTRDDGDDWSIGMRCPCGCGEVIELMLLEEARPRWDLKTDENNRPTLHPSVWRRKGCRSHFWVRKGHIFWCE